jgi:hypothetical protein
VFVRPSISNRRDMVDLQKVPYCAGCALEHGHLLSSGLKVLRRNNGAENLGGHVPKLVVLSAEQHDDAVALGVEAAGDMEETLLDDLLDALGADGQVLAEGVVRPAGLDKLEDGVGLDGSGRHLGGGCVRSSGVGGSR